MSQDYVPLQTWMLGKAVEKTIDVASELTLGVDGKIYFVSDKSEVVEHLEGNLKPTGEAVSLERLWTLPKGIIQPEALVALAEGSMLIGTDAKKVTTNLFQLVETKE